MAVNLVAAGHSVHAYVRRSEQIGGLQAIGVKPTMDISDLADSKIVISMLPDDDAVRDAFFGDRKGTNGLADVWPQAPFTFQ
jgi:3-hydroxyisobutyrate dehydrogenase-like beta-hydroxyacid dehydrogenase